MYEKIEADGTALASQADRISELEKLVESMQLEREELISSSVQRAGDTTCPGVPQVESKHEETVYEGKHPEEDADDDWETALREEVEFMREG